MTLFESSQPKIEVSREKVQNYLYQHTALIQNNMISDLFDTIIASRQCSTERSKFLTELVTILRELFFSISRFLKFQLKIMNKDKLDTILIEKNKLMALVSISTLLEEINDMVTSSKAEVFLASQFQYDLSHTSVLHDLVNKTCSSFKLFNPCYKDSDLFSVSFAKACQSANIDDTASRTHLSRFFSPELCVSATVSVGAIVVMVALGSGIGLAFGVALLTAIAEYAVCQTNREMHRENAL